MININTYIIEKFKISKDIKTSSPRTNFKEGEMLLHIELVIKKNEDSATLQIENHIFEEFKGSNKLSLKSWIYYTTPKCFINSNGYWEYHHDNPSAGYFIVIFINKEDGLSLLEDLLKEDPSNIGVLLEDYFDKKDDVSTKKITMEHSDNYIKNLISELK